MVPILALPLKASVILSQSSAQCRKGGCTHSQGCCKERIKQDVYRSCPGAWGQGRTSANPVPFRPLCSYFSDLSCPL